MYKAVAMRLVFPAVGFTVRRHFFGEGRGGNGFDAAL